MNESNRTLDPLLIAYKIRDIRNFEHQGLFDEIEQEPRFLELLWALQWFSQADNYQGGLRRFTETFLAANLDKIGTPTMRAAGKAEAYTWAQFLKIIEETPAQGSPDDSEWSFLRNAVFLGEGEDSLEEFKKYPPAVCRENAVLAAKEHLHQYLRDLCQSPITHFERRDRFSGGNAPWYWPTVCRDLLAWLDQRSAKVASEIAQTRVTDAVFKWLRMAKECELPVWLNGSSRFGKSESIRAFAKARPGLFRVVETPEDNSILSLCKAIATALGIDSEGQTALQLRGKIEVVLRASGIMLILDEAHFIFGSTFTRNARPQRLDMVRRLIIDAGLPLAFVSTPQSYDQARRKFEKATSYTFEQLDGRLLTQQSIDLPEEISHEEVLAVAEIHLPGLAADYYEIVARKAEAVKGSVFSYVKSVSRVTLMHARDAGRTKPRLCDIQAAVEDILPGARETAQVAPKVEAVKKAAIDAREVFSANTRHEPVILSPSRIENLAHRTEQKETESRPSFAAAAA